MATAWEQTPEYFETSNWTQTPGGPTEYTVARSVGADPADVTSFHPGQATWSPNHLPNILYVLKPPAEWHEYRRSSLPDSKVDKNGNVIYEKWPKNPSKPEPLLNFPHLPDQIGSQEWWFVFEAWRRFEPRARWRDFMMRIHGPSRPSSHNNIQMHISRSRPKWALLCWYTINLHKDENRAREEAMSLLSTEQIRQNTTRGTTPGLIDRTKGEAGGRVPLPITKPGAGVRRGPRRPGKGHGGGNNQEKYKSKAERKKTKVSHQPARVPGYEDEGDYELPLQNSTSALDADLGHAITLNDVLTQLPRTGARYSYPSQPRLALDYAVGTGQGFHSTGIHSDPVDYYSSYELPDGFGAKQVGNVPPGLDSAILCPSEQPDHPEDFALIAQRSSAPNSGCSGLNQSNHSARIKRKVNAALGSVRDLVVPKVARLEAYGSTTSNEVNPRSYGGSIQTLARQIDKEAFSAEVHAQSATPPHPTATRSSPKVKPLIEKKIKDTMKRKRHFVDEGKDEERLGKVARGHSDLLGRPSKTHYNRVHSKSTHQSAPLLAATTYAAFRRRDPHLEIASPTPSDIIATANAEGDLLSVNSVQPEPVPESNKPFVIGTPRHSRTKRFTTPTQLARPPVDGADSGRRTVRHYNPSVSDQELDFWACRNEPRVKWEVDAYPATNDHESLQFGPALPYEAFMPETVQTTVDDADQTGHNLESDYIAFLPASWYDETSEITDASIIKPEDEPALDPTLSGSTTPNVAMSEWMNADFEF